MLLAFAWSWWHASVVTLRRIFAAALNLQNQSMHVRMHEKVRLALVQLSSLAFCRILSFRQICQQRLPRRLLPSPPQPRARLYLNAGLLEASSPQSTRPQVPLTLLCACYISSSASAHSSPSSHTCSRYMRVRLLTQPPSLGLRPSLTALTRPGIRAQQRPSQCILRLPTHSQPLRSAW
jgi:hypothetical protein